MGQQAFSGGEAEIFGVPTGYSPDTHQTLWGNELSLGQEGLPGDSRSDGVTWLCLL